MHEYTLQFRTLAAASGWNKASLFTAFRQGLEPKLRLQLASFYDSHGLESFIQHATRCSNCLQECSPASQTPRYRRTETQNLPESDPKPMQTDTNHLTPAEQQRRMIQGLCLYCGTSEHHILACPLRPPCPVVSYIKPSPIKMNPLTTNAQLTAAHITLPVTALLWVSRELHLSRPLPPALPTNCHHLPSRNHLPRNHLPSNLYYGKTIKSAACPL